jgi:hypothetical protein
MSWHSLSTPSSAEYLSVVETLDASKKGRELIESNVVEKLLSATSDIVISLE